MSMEEMMFWDRWPDLLILYQPFRDLVLSRHEDVDIRVAKTQISFYNRHMFAMASPPLRRRKGWPREYMLVSFGLPYQVESERIAESTEAYPNRWTHHVLVEEKEDLDQVLMGWVDEAYRFSMSKR